MKTNQLTTLLLAFILLILSADAVAQSFSINVIQDMCLDDGEAEIILNNIPEPVTAVWTNTSTQDTWTGLNPNTLKDGYYYVLVTDANDIVYDSAYVGIQPGLRWFHQNWPDGEAPCPLGTASADISIQGGVSDYEIWINGTLDGTSSSNDYTTSPLDIGFHDVYIIDSEGCRSGYSTFESGPTQIEIEGVTDLEYDFEFIETSCGVYDVIPFIVTESAPPYVNYWSYWQDGVMAEEYAEVLTGISPGTSIQYHTTDANGCEITFSQSFNPPNALQASGNSYPAFCPIDNGSIDMYIYGGTAPYTFEWSNGATTEDISGLAYGNYTLTVEDAEGCTYSQTKHVAQSNSIFISGIATPPNCEETLAGNIDVTVQGGVEPYTFLWSNGETTEDISFMEFGYYYVTITDAEGCVDGKSFYVPVSDPCYAYVSGTSYYDLDGNCAVNGYDFPINTNIYSTNGNYLFNYEYSNNYTRRFLEDVEVTSQRNGYDLICPAADVPLTYIANEHYTDVDFYLQPQSLEDDICLTLWSENPVPGFDGDAYINVSNPGTTLQPVIVTLEYTTLIDFTFASPAPTSVDEDAGIVTWDLGLINPNSSTSVNIEFYTAATVDLGEEVTFTATLNDLATDINPDNNSRVVVKEVIGSYDPNDKQVTPSGVGETNMIDPLTDELMYRVRFQNTGTAPAVNVVIKDEIDISKLDIQSLQVVNTSHTLTDVMYDENEVLFSFENIYLPDSVADLEGSQGYIYFKIKVNEGLPLGTVIENDAAIFFDFNEPIITNTSFVTLDEESTVTEQLNASFEVFPNPTSAELNVRLEREIDAIEVLDITGKVVYQVQVNAKNTKIDLPSFISNGMYLVKIYSGEFVGSKKFALQR